MPARPRLAVFKFASCDGCQLSLLDAEDELLAFAEAVEISFFLEATSEILPGPYDIGLVEGSITTPHDAERIQRIRSECRYLMTIGACATSGGIQALRNWGDHTQFLQAVYASPQYISTLATSTGIADHVAVDFELRGCPINQHQLIHVLTDLLHGRNPRVPKHSVCLDCKRSGAVCIAVARGVPCIGPLTQSGCGALCPTYNRGCYGCYGPAFQGQPSSLVNHYLESGHPPGELVPLLRNYNANSPRFGMRVTVWRECL